MRALTISSLIVTGIVLMLYGLFACTYGGDSTGADTYVLVGGHRMDATFAGLLALVAAFVAFWLAVRIRRR